MPIAAGMPCTYVLGQRNTSDVTRQSLCYHRDSDSSAHTKPRGISKIQVHEVSGGESVMMSWLCQHRYAFTDHRVCTSHVNGYIRSESWPVKPSLMLIFDDGPGGFPNGDRRQRRVRMLGCVHSKGQKVTSGLCVLVETLGPMVREHVDSRASEPVPHAPSHSNSRCSANGDSVHHRKNRPCVDVWFKQARVR